MSVYLIQCVESGAVKIGHADDPVKRLAQLQTGNPGTLALLGSFRGGAVEEGELHTRFAGDRLQGEWFDLDEADLSSLLERVEQEQAIKDDLRTFFREQKVCYPDLCYLVSRAVGFPVSVYWFGLSKKNMEYQVMRWREGPGPGLEFWHWVMNRYPNSQFFPTPEDAAATFVERYREWLARESPRA